jgi:uncharacterized protein with PIN domain
MDGEDVRHTEDGASVELVTPPPPAERFVLEYALYRMCKHLRIMGYDCVSDAQYSHEKLMDFAARHNRILVCCSPKLLPRLRRVAIELANGSMVDGIHPPEKKLSRKKKNQLIEVYSDDDDAPPTVPMTPASLDGLRFVFINHHANFKIQMEELVSKLGLKCDMSKIFSRCLKCGDLIVDVQKETIQERVHPNVYVLYNAFFQCPTCEKVYWGVDTNNEVTEVLNYKAMRSLQYMTSYGVQTRSHTHYQLFRVIPLVIKVRVLTYLTAQEVSIVSSACKACYDLVNNDYVWCWLCGEMPSAHGITATSFRPQTYTAADLLLPCSWKKEFLRRLVAQK